MLNNNKVTVSKKSRAKDLEENKADNDIEVDLKSVYHDFEF